MDPICAIGLAGNALQLTGLAASVLVKIYRYFLDVRDSPKQASDLRQEFGIVFSQLEAISSQSSDWVSSDPTNLQAALEVFRELLIKINDRARPDLTKGIERLKWPFKKEETIKLLGDLERCKTTFN